MRRGREARACLAAVARKLPIMLEVVEDAFSTPWPSRSLP